MDGNVDIESTPDKGSTFTVTLTLKAAPADSPLAACCGPRRRRNRRPLRARSARLRVLVVDDHPVNREVLVRQLELLGLAADSANDGVEALRPGPPGNYAAVLADIHMPRMDGYELTRQIRSGRGRSAGRSGRTPVVAVTANAMKGEEERCLAAGMDAYLVKAGEHRPTAHHAGALAPGRARRQRPRGRYAGYAEPAVAIDRRRARRLARRRLSPPSTRCWQIPRHRGRDPARDRQRLAQRQSRRAGRRRAQAQGGGADASVPRASAPRLPRWSRPARRATARAAATGWARSLRSCAA